MRATSIAVCCWIWALASSSCIVLGFELHAAEAGPPPPPPPLLLQLGALALGFHHVLTMVCLSVQLHLELGEFLFLLKLGGPGLEIGLTVGAFWTGSISPCDLTCSACIFAAAIWPSCCIFC